MTWPDWYLAIEADLNSQLPPPPSYIQLEDGTWLCERWIGYGRVVTTHATWEQAWVMGQNLL